MSLDEFDRERDELERSLDALGAELFTLEQDPTLTALASLRLRGESARRWAEAQDVITRLWLSYAQVRERLTEAAAVRDRDEAKALVTDARLSTPLAPEGARVADLLDLMTRAHGQAALVVSTIALTWDLCLPRLRMAEAEIDTLTSEANRLGLAGVVSSALSAELAELNERVVGDPLSVTVDKIEILERQVEDRRDDLAAIAELQARWSDELARARETLVRVHGIGLEATRAGHEARAKVFNARVIEAHGEDGLGDGLRVIEDFARSQRWIETHRALVAWHAAADDLERRHRTTLAENLAPLHRRRELLGRLSAYRDKTAALSLAEDSRLELMFRDAQAELTHRPTHLCRADALIERYRAAIVATQARRVS